MKPPLKLVKKLPVARRRLVIPAAVVGPDGLYHGDDDRQLVKFDLDTLDERWRIQAKRVRVVRAFEDAVLLSAHDGTRRAIRPTGEEIWRQRTGRKWAVWHDKVLVLTESGLNVLDVRTGGSVDFLDLPASASLGPVWCDLLFFSTERVGDPCGAYDLAGRRLLWKRDLMQEIHSAFGITEQYPGAGLVLGSGGRYVATRGLHTFGGSMEDGHLLWCSPEDSLHAWPNVDGGRIYMLSSQAKDPLVTHFVALEEATGATVYDISLADHSPPLPMKLGRALRGVLLDEHIAFSSDSGVLVVFRLSDGMPVWHYRHDESLWGGTTDGRRLYVSANDGNILVFEGQEA